VCEEYTSFGIEEQIASKVQETSRQELLNFQTDKNQILERA